MKRRYNTIASHQLKKHRKRWHRQQGKTCPILKQVIPYDQTSVDHKHKRKNDPIGVNDDGYIRGVIHIQANSMEGKIANAFKRYGLNKFIDLPTFLRNLADYLEDPPLVHKKIVHPNEMPKKKKLGKREFNKLYKHYFDIYPNKTVLPKWPKSGKATKQIKKDLKKLREFLK